MTRQDFFIEQMRFCERNGIPVHSSQRDEYERLTGRIEVKEIRRAGKVIMPRIFASMPEPEGY